MRLIHITIIISIIIGNTISGDNPTNPPTSITSLCCECTTTLNTVGCPQDQKCEDIICQHDSYCCTVQWDFVCTPTASQICFYGTKHPTRNPTSTPTYQPTYLTTTPTISPTQSPNVYTDEIGCGDTLRTYIGVNDEKVYSLIINQNTTEVFISLCTEFTSFPTKMILEDVDDNYNHSIIAYDELCEPTSQNVNNSTFIIMPNGLYPGHYFIRITGKNSYNFGIFAISILCVYTTSPTISPTFAPIFSPTFLPTVSPTFSPTFSPIMLPTFSPTVSPILSPTISPTFSPTTTSPTTIPTFLPTPLPSPSPTRNPTVADMSNAKSPVWPTISPSIVPTTHDVSYQWPTISPTIEWDDDYSNEKRKQYYGDASSSTHDSNKYSSSSSYVSSSEKKHHHPKEPKAGGNKDKKEQIHDSPMIYNGSVMMYVLVSISVAFLLTAMVVAVVIYHFCYKSRNKHTTLDNESDWSEGATIDNEFIECNNKEGATIDEETALKN